MGATYKVADKLGTVVTWSTSGVFLGRDEFVKALQDRGIRTAVPVREKGTYLRRALEEAVGDGLIRKIGEDDTRVSFAVVEERKSLDAGDWKGKLTEAATLHKATDQISFTVGTELGTRIKRALETQSGGLLGREVASVFYRFLLSEADGVALRPSGGVLFVPKEMAQALDDIDAVVRAVPALRGRFHLHRFDVGADQRTMADVTRLFRAQVVGELRRVKDYVERVCKEEKVTPRYFKGREKEIAGMASQVKRLQVALGTEMNDVTMQLKLYSRFLTGKFAEAERQADAAKVLRRDQRKAKTKKK